MIFMSGEMMRSNLLPSLILWLDDSFWDAGGTNWLLTCTQW